MTHEIQEFDTSAYQASPDARIIETMIAETGVNPAIIYCQNTGAPIGQINPAEFRILIQMVGESEDDETIMDDLMTRTVLSMRPSPAFNYIHSDTMGKMFTHAPYHFCSFLLARYYRINRKLADPTLAENIARGQKQILLFRQVQSLQFGADAKADWFLHRLIELDLKFNIAQVTSAKDFPLDSTQLNFVNIECYNKALESLVNALESKKSTLERQAKLHESWMAGAGSRIVGDAYMKSFFKLQPLTPAKVAEQEKNKTRGSIRMLMRQMLDGDSPVEIIRPVAAPSAPLSPTINGVPRLRFVAKS